MDEQELKEHMETQRAQILSEPPLDLGRMAEELHEIASRLHELNAGLEVQVWARFPHTWDDARPVLRLLRNGAAHDVTAAAVLLAGLAGNAPTES